MLNREMVQQQREGKSRTTELRIVASGKDKSVAGITFIHVQLETKIELFFLGERCTSWLIFLIFALKFLLFDVLSRTWSYKIE